MAFNPRFVWHIDVRDACCGGAVCGCRYKFWGDICTDVARKMAEPETEAFFAKLIQRVVPKSDAQCIAEVQTSRKWLEYVGGDQARMMARSFGVPGDHNGQETRGYVIKKNTRM